MSLSIIVLYASDNIGAAWSVSKGIPATLNRMGHRMRSYTSDSLPDAMILRMADLIILSGVEHFHEKLLAKYGLQWFAINVPKASIYHESLTREDQTWDFTRLKPLADTHFFPAVQDAAKYGGIWLPFGVDTEYFKSYGMPKTIPYGFIGSVYGKRVDYLNSLGFTLPRIPLQNVGTVEQQTIRLAQAYQSCKVFVNLPSLSQLLVTKVLEVLATGTFLLTPTLTGEGRDNMLLFKDGTDLVYYDSPQDLKAKIDYYTNHEPEREAIAAQGLRAVNPRFSLDNTLKCVLNNLGFTQ